MAKRRRFDRVTLDGARSHRRESDGALIVPGRFARTGCQTYANEDGSERIEYRPRDEVLSSVPSFEGVAVTDRHPPDGGFVDPTNWRRLAMGHMQGVRVVDGDDEETWLEADIVIAAGELADAIERRERSELSAGYYCDFVEGQIEHRGETADGSQVGIVGNHVAALGLGEARAGRGARMLLDSQGNGIAPDHGERKGSEMKFTIRVDGIDYEVEAPTQALAQAIAQERARRDEEMSELEEEKKSLDEEKSGLEAKLQAAEKEVADLKDQISALEDPERKASDARELLDLTERAAVVAGRKLDATGTPHEIRLAALKAGGEDVLAAIPEARKTDAAYVEVYTAARFDAHYEARKSARQSVTTPRSDGGQSTADPIIAALERNDAARTARSRQLRGLPVERG